MKHAWPIICFAAFLTCGTGSLWAIAATPHRPPDLGTQVRTLFAAKCVECHAAKLQRPKGKFGYVLDLKRIAANPKFVVPFDPEASKLWTQIEDAEMPPDDAKEGSLTEAEEHLVRLWVEAGAPAPLTASLAAESVAATLDQTTPTLATRLLQLLGKLHVLVIHFPIALLAAAAIGESWWMWKRYPGMSPFVRFCVLLGGAGAIVAAVLGWIHASYGGFGNSGQAMMLHRWLGTTAAVGALLTLAASEWDVIRRHRSVLFRGVLFASAAIVGAAGHFGGMLVYGNDFFHF
jgi:mono/diheme cytochrome c family protein